MTLTKTCLAIVLIHLSLLPSAAKAEEVHGRVSDPSGSVIPRARVTASIGGKKVVSSTTDSAGQYALTVAAGSYLIQTKSPRFRSAAKNVTVINGQTAEVDFQLALEGVSQSVTVMAEHDYRVLTADTATKTNISLLETPQDIAVVNHDVIEDQQDYELSGAARDVSGVTRANPVASGQINNLFVIRGFQLDYDNNYLLDGIKYPGFAASDIANIEQVEILKGPASVLYGKTEAGGVVNLITKKPLDSSDLSLQFMGGNYAFTRTQLDLSGPLSRSRVLLYRIDGAYQNGDEDQFRDFVHFHHVFVAPSLLWKPREGTTLSLRGEYLKQDNTVDGGIPAVGNRPAPVLITSFYGEPFNEGHDLDRQLGFDFRQQVGSKWSLQNAFSWFRLGNSYFAVTGRSVTSDHRTLLRGLNAFSYPEDMHHSETDLTGTFSTGRIAHQVVAGLELGWTDTGFIGPEVDYPSVDILHPIYNQLTLAQATQSLMPGNPSYYAFDIVGANQIAAGYVQDMIALGPVRLLGGVRVDRFRQKSVNSIYDRTTRQDNTVPSPRVGFVYMLLKGVSLYGDYTRSFSPQPPTDVSSFGQPFVRPEYATQYEAGIKMDSFHSRVSSTLAFFDIGERNALSPDPANSTFYIQVGEQRSKGIDLDITANIANGWNVLVGYEYDQAQVVADNSLPAGNLLIDAPRNSGNLWTTYGITKGPLRGLGIGAGLSATSIREGDLLNSFALPGYAKVDTTLYYTAQETRRGSWRLSLNIKNALDRKFYETSTGPATIRPGAPLTILAAVRFTYR
jgi:iron complex outermembrane receptor protein